LILRWLLLVVCRRRRRRLALLELLRRRRLALLLMLLMLLLLALLEPLLEVGARLRGRCLDLGGRLPRGLFGRKPLPFDEKVRGHAVRPRAHVQDGLHHVPLLLWRRRGLPELLLLLLLLLVLLLRRWLVLLLLRWLVLLLLRVLLLRRRLPWCGCVVQVSQVSADAIAPFGGAQISDGQADASGRCDNQLRLNQPRHHLLIWHARGKAW